MYSRARNIGFTDDNLEVRPSSENYADDYMEIDIALDTFPYPGGGTTCDALYLGTPVITMYGSRHGSRFGYSILKNIGLDALTAETKDDYIMKAVLLAEDKELRNALHASLRNIIEQSPVMNGRQYISDIESFYEKIYIAWQNSV